MTIEVVCKRQISKKMKLVKTVEEVYKHINLQIIDEHKDYNKIFLLITKEIVEEYSTIFLSKEYNFIIADFINLEQEQIKKLKKLNENIIFIKDEFIFEIEILKNTTEMNRLAIITKHLTNVYPQGKFDILCKESLLLYVNNTPFQDIAIESELRVPFDTLNDNEHCTSDGTFLNYDENIEFRYRDGKVSKGTLMISPLNVFEGEVIEKDRRTYIEGYDINRAMHGDEVYIEDNRIVGVYKTKTRIVVGTFYKWIKGPTYNYGVVRPIDRRLSDVYVTTYLDEDTLNKKVVVHIVDWKVSQSLPRGIIFKILGNNGNYDDEITAINEHCNVEYKDENWNESCNRQRRCLGMEEHKISSNHIIGKTCESLGFDKNDFSIKRAEKEVTDGKRKDLRHLEVCSIDPLGCTDIDDALHCIKKGNFVEVGVHIADVSFYVTEGSILDLESKSRSTTVYLPSYRIDMLPPFLSSELCSLIEGQDRATFSCIWKFDLNFNVISREIVKTIVRSRTAFSYEEADKIIKNKKNNPLKASLDLLQEIAKKLRADRFENGALELSNHEAYVDKDCNITREDGVDTHYLVEEFMLLANITVANFMFAANPEYSLLRKHPLPSAINLDNIDCSNSKTLNSSLKSLTEEQRTITKKLITRSMQQALYFCSGESSDFYHYGLATPIYTHFTSPIRRYPDIVVHRTLYYILNNDEQSIDKLKDYVNYVTCSKMNYRHRNAQNAGRMAQSLLMYKAIEKDLAQSSSNILESVVMSIKKGGVVLYIQRYGIEAFLKTTDKYKVFDTLKVSIDIDFFKFCRDRYYVVTKAYG